jgi:GMP synthase-like glutamine amidotransferase
MSSTRQLLEGLALVGCRIGRSTGSKSGTDTSEHVGRISAMMRRLRVKIQRSCLGQGLLLQDLGGQ